MNIYEVALTIKVNPMWYFISGMLSRQINKEITRLFNLNKNLTTLKKLLL